MRTEGDVRCLTIENEELMVIDEKKITRIFGWSILVITTIMYLLTVAPTLLFWDCGERITASYIMGTPHPPGAPFYLLLGRIFTMIPFAEDIGLRVNLISSFASSISVLFLFLISVRLIRNWRGPAAEISDIYIIYGSSAIGALTFAFTYTFWHNAVESEAYALSMFFTSFVLWLIFVWIEKHKDHDSSKYLLMIMLLVGLGTGVHLLNILTLPIVVFIMWHYDRRTALITGFGIALSLMVLFAFPLDWKIYSLFVFIAFTVVFQRIENNEDLSLMFIMPLLLILGYSTYLMVYIRAGLNPPMNQNDPSNWQRMLAYLRREQYGDEAQLRNSVMVLFGEPNRKYLESLEKIGAVPGGPNDPWGGHWTFFWKYQVVEMYVRYFNWQFIGIHPDKFDRIVTLDKLYAIPFLAGLWGAIHHFFKDWKKALALSGLFIIMSLGLVIYQNQDYLQPRERHYFYMGSFFIFSIWIGVGFTSLMESMFDKQKMKKLIPPVAFAGLLIPVLMINANYFLSNRTGNYVAWDYPYNILQTCDENAILFTNGDNDTFPVWYLQEVEGIRQDVQVVNLSLLNTGWYIRQMKEKMPDLIRYTDRQIDEFFDAHHMTSEGFMRRYWPEKRKLQIPSEDRTSVIEWELGPTMHITVQGQPEGFLRIQDQMAMEIIAHNARNGWKRPVYFAVTVGSSNFLGLDDYLRMDGLCFRLVDYKTRNSIKPDILYDRLLNRFLTAYRNLDNPRIYYDDNIIRMLQNYRSAFLQLAIHFDEHVHDQNQQDDPSLDTEKIYDYGTFLTFSKNDKKRYLLDNMERLIPASVIPYTNEMIIAEVAGMYADIGNRVKGRELISEVDVMGLSRNRLMRFLIYLSSREYEETSVLLLEEYIENMPYRRGRQERFETLFELYAGFVSVDDKNAPPVITRAIISELQLLNNTGLRNDLFKEFAILVYQGGNKELSLKILEDYHSLNPEDTETLELIFQIHMIDDDYKNALDALNRYLEIDPHDQEYIQSKKELESIIEMGN